MWKRGCSLRWVIWLQWSWQCTVLPGGPEPSPSKMSCLFLLPCCMAALLAHSYCNHYFFLTFHRKKKNTTQQQHQTSKWQSVVRPPPFQKVASKAAPAPFCFLRLRRQATSLALSQLLGCRPGSSWQPRHTRPMGPAARPAPGTWPETLGQGAGGSAGCPSSAPTGWAWQTCCICWLLHQRLSYYN